LVGGFQGDGFTTFDQGKGRVSSISGQGRGQAVDESPGPAEAVYPGEGGGFLARSEHRLRGGV
jgi:hypothetical protein